MLIDVNDEVPSPEIISSGCVCSVDHIPDVLTNEFNNQWMMFFFALARYLISR